MKSAFEELRANRAPAACAGIGKEVKEAAQRIERGVNDAKAAVAEKLDDGVVAARRLLKRSRHTVEDKLDETARAIKQHPFRSLAIGFTAGAVFGLLLPRPGRR
jgi:ElaB/YqjD/DUF883 family membrane-anchored ribosome-binding protein